MCKVQIPKSDVILFNDSLHYVDKESQKSILERAIGSLTENGFIVVRDGDASKTETHNKIEQTEVWSTKILKFNKTTEQLCFVSADWMKQLAKENNMNIKVRQCDKDSSETLYILTKSSNEEI